MLVCDFCGSQTQINLDEKENKCFEISISVCDLGHVIKGNNYGVKAKSFHFCDKNCMIEYLKNNMEINGKFKEKEK